MQRQHSRSVLRILDISKQGIRREVADCDAAVVANTQT